MPERQRMWFEGQPVTVLRVKQLPTKRAEIRLPSGFTKEVAYKKLKPMEDRDVLASFSFDET